MQGSSTFRVHHRPLRHKYRRVWGGALVPGVLVLCFYAYLVLSVWSENQGAPTGRRLLDEQLRPQRISFKTVLIAINTTAAKPTEFNDLSQRAETLAVAISAIGALTAVTSVSFVCLLWRRVNQLQAMLQPEAVLRV